MGTSYARVFGVSRQIGNTRPVGNNLLFLFASVYPMVSLFFTLSLQNRKNEAHVRVFLGTEFTRQQRPEEKGDESRRLHR